MPRKLLIAIGLQLAILMAVFVPPLLLKMTGTVVYLETAPMDPRDFIRGDYVILGYKVGEGAVTQEAATLQQETGAPLYVTVTTDRPAKFVAAGFAKPTLMSGQACLTGRVRPWALTVDFPQLAQFFVSEGEGKAIEAARGENLLARAVTSSNCNAVLSGLELR